MWPQKKTSHYVANKIDVRSDETNALPIKNKLNV